MVSPPGSREAGAAGMVTMARRQTQTPSTAPRKRRPTKADLEAELTALRQEKEDLVQPGLNMLPV